MKVACYVPVKFNSTRTPGKNIKPLYDGKPLCKLLFETLSKVKNIDEKYCFCSDERIVDYLEPSIEFLRRSEKLDTDQTQCHDLMHAFVEEVNPDVIVLCHVTSPFLKKSTIEECVNKVLYEGYDSAFTAERVRDFLWKDGNALNFNPAEAPRTQDLPEIFKETNGCFVIRREVFDSTNRKVGFRPYIKEISFPETQDVNYPEDFLMTDLIYKNGLYKEV
jgi:CMP-N-acetylneuraminic acid synthetase